MRHSCAAGHQPCSRCPAAAAQVPPLLPPAPPAVPPLAASPRRQLVCQPKQGAHQAFTLSKPPAQDGQSRYEWSAKALHGQPQRCSLGNMLHAAPICCTSASACLCLPPASPASLLRSAGTPHSMPGRMPAVPKKTAQRHSAAATQHSAATAEQADAHLLVMADMLTLMKCAPLSEATALASIVLPVPGGPNSSRPAGGARRGGFSIMVRHTARQKGLLQHQAGTQATRLAGERPDARAVFTERQQALRRYCSSHATERQCLITWQGTRRRAMLLTFGGFGEGATSEQLWALQRQDDHLCKRRGRVHMSAARRQAGATHLWGVCSTAPGRGDAAAVCVQHGVRQGRCSRPDVPTERSISCSIHCSSLPALLPVPTSCSVSLTASSAPMSSNDTLISSGGMTFKASKRGRGGDGGRRWRRATHQRRCTAQDRTGRFSSAPVNSALHCPSLLASPRSAAASHTDPQPHPSAPACQAAPPPLLPPCAPHLLQP